MLQGKNVFITEVSGAITLGCRQALKAAGIFRINTDKMKKITIFEGGI